MNRPQLLSIIKKVFPHIIKAGLISLTYFSQYIYKTQESQSYTNIKDDNSPVTLADKKIEHYLRESLNKLYPDHGIIGEEFASYKSNARYLWILDPIDGTQSFITGVPLYTILVGLVDTQTNTPCLSFVYAPATGECVYACKDLGSFFVYIDNLSTKVSAIIKQAKPIFCNTKNTSISQSLLLSYDWAACLKENKVFLEIIKTASLTRTWADGYAYILLTTGRADAVIDPKMHVWDIIPLYTLIKESRGLLLTFEKKELDVNTLLQNAKNNITPDTCNVISAANTNIINEIVSYL